MKKLIYEIQDGGDVCLYEMQAIDNGINDQTAKMLFYKNDHHWNQEYRGKLNMELHDHGNGVKIKIHNGIEMNVDYDHVSDLYLLLKFFYEDSDFSKIETNLNKWVKK